VERDADDAARTCAALARIGVQLRCGKTIKAREIGVGRCRGQIIVGFGGIPRVGLCGKPVEITADDAAEPVAQNEIEKIRARKLRGRGHGENAANGVWRKRQSGVPAPEDFEIEIVECGFGFETP